MTNSEISEVFEQIAEILEIKGENPFKIRAYLNAAIVINRLGENLSDIILENRHFDIPGIGKDLSLKIKELVNTGRLIYYDELVKSVPKGLLELMKLRGLGPKKANLLYKNFHIEGIRELYGAIESKKLSKIQGFGEKSIENLKKSIEEHWIFQQRFLYADAMNQAKAFEAYLKNTPQKLTGEVMLAGSLRRKMETVGDIDIVASVVGGKEKAFAEIFLNYKEILRVESSGETKISVVLKSGIHMDLRIVHTDDFVYALHHFTGSKLHNEELRAMEKKHGYKINEYGIFTHKKGEPENKIKVNNETEFYDTLGMQFIPPELREGTGEIEAALSRGIPRLVEEEDLLGVFHIHTACTDGKNSLEEMVEACIKQGYKYAGISDHSVSAHYANGLTAKELESQIEYIDRLNKKYEGIIKIFKGIESDILPDGNLDYDEKTLMKLDFVIASVHSNFNMSESVMTERIINAVKNPYTTMIGHLTGRLLLERKGYEVDVSKVLDYASKYKTIIELNANPKRLDIDWRHIREAISKNVLISINPDAHNTPTINFVNYGINIARKGWASKADILNTRNVIEISGILKSIREYKKKL
ncbi:MAG: DNA polymerase/3'-5' exonuclease PolX [bacterium]